MSRIELWAAEAPPPSIVTTPIPTMPFPFPGMDPYLEGDLWGDCIRTLASKIRQMLVPNLRPHYTARLEICLIEEHRIPTIEIHDAANNSLVTSIEILSPVNKRESGLTQYRQKRQRLYQAEVHLIELDFLRRGTRPFDHPRLPIGPYFVMLTRARSAAVDLWPIALQQSLPIIPVLLKPEDADVALDLGAALVEIYDEAGYDLSIDYTQSSPPPALTVADESWCRSRQ
jgi:hypothetical protein